MAANVAPPIEVTEWLDGLGDDDHAKLARAKLTAHRDSSVLSAYVECYIDSRTDVSPATITTFRRAQNKLSAFFKPSVLVRDVTPGDADEFSRWLRDPSGGALSEATARKTISIARQIFRAAIRKRLIRSNPFDGLSGAIRSNPDRKVYVDAATILGLIDEIPTDQTERRLLLALARFQGMRIASEPAALRWADIDWARQRMTVTDVKNRRHEGKGTRLVPIFPETLPFLLDARERAEIGSEYVFPMLERYRRTGADQNLRQWFMQLLKRNGLTPWPKLFHALRASRQTDLMKAGFPQHVINKWIGNSRAVAEEHYLMVTEADYAKAVQNPVHEVMQNQVQQPTAKKGEAVQNPVHSDRSHCEETIYAATRGVLQGDSTYHKGSKMGVMGVTGLEPVTSSV